MWCLLENAVTVYTGEPKGVCLEGTRGANLLEYNLIGPLALEAFISVFLSKICILRKRKHT